MSESATETDAYIETGRKAQSTHLLPHVFARISRTTSKCSFDVVSLYGSHTAYVKKSNRALMTRAPVSARMWWSKRLTSTWRNGRDDSRDDLLPCKWQCWRGWECGFD